MPLFTLCSAMLHRHAEGVAHSPNWLRQDHSWVLLSIYLGNNSLGDPYLGLLSRVCHRGPLLQQQSGAARLAVVSQDCCAYSGWCAACLQIKFMLPGVPPTHKKVSIPLIVVVSFEGDKVCPMPIQYRPFACSQKRCRFAPLLPVYICGFSSMSLRR